MPKEDVGQLLARIAENQDLIAGHIERIADRLDRIEQTLDALCARYEDEARFEHALRRWRNARYPYSVASAALLWWHYQWLLNGPDESKYEPLPEGVISNIAERKRAAREQYALQAQQRARARRGQSWEASS